MLKDFTDRFRDALRSGENLVTAPGASDSILAFARSVSAGLGDEPKWLHCRFLYDAEGSRLFEEITAQPEYYPTRTEAAILAKHADRIREITGPVNLVELGSGYSVKTEHLLNAYLRDGTELRYVPVDVSVSALREASRSIHENFANVQFTAIAGTYASAFPLLGELTPEMVIFLGSTIGNFNEAEATAFRTAVSGHLPTGNFFLLGVDLVKDVEILEAAYNDAAGITARFTKNYLTRMNRELDAGIDTDQVEHEAVWNPARERMEISLRFRTEQRVHVSPLNESFRIRAGERILVEISRKFRLAKLREELYGFGFEPLHTFTDEREWFALLLLRRRDDFRLRTTVRPHT